MLVAAQYPRARSFNHTLSRNKTMPIVPRRLQLCCCCTIITIILCVFADDPDTTREFIYPHCEGQNGYNQYGYQQIIIGKCVLQDVEITLNTTLYFEHSQFTTLQCRRCLLHSIPVGLFSNPRLKRVLLPDSGLERLTVKDFIGAGGLVELNISHNTLTAIEAHQFMMARSLSSLDLSHNRIEHIDESAFVDHHQLSYLNLAHNRLHALPATLPSTLRQLELQNNAFGGEFSLLVHVEQLDLSHNQIER